MAVGDLQTLVRQYGGEHIANLHSWQMKVEMERVHISLSVSLDQFLLLRMLIILQLHAHCK